MKKVKLSQSQQEKIENLIRFGRYSGENVSIEALPCVIQNVRKVLHMTQHQLAKRVGVSQSLIARLESGKISPTWATLEKVFNALECDLLCLPVMREPLEFILRKQARQYLKTQNESSDEDLEQKVETLLRIGSSEIWD